MNLNIDDIESRLEETEKQTEGVLKEKQEIESKEQHLMQALHQLESDITVKNILQNKETHIEQEKQNIGEKIEEYKQTVTSLEKELQGLIEETQMSEQTLEELSACGESIEDSLGILADRKQIIETCTERLQNVMEKLDAYSNIEMTENIQNLSNYMNEHDYGIEDYEKYSKDPEWQQLHEKAYPQGENISSLPLPASDTYLNGLPLRPSPRGNWEVISAATPAYDAFLENESMYTIENYRPVQTKTIDAREIVGIDMIDDRHIQNFETFWNRSGKSFEDFKQIALQMPEVQRRLDCGEKLNDLMNDARLGKCAHLFFNTDDIDHPTVYEGDGFYELSGGGRHRVMLAQMLGYSMPVRVGGRYVSKE